jgi:tol-pal system protein YbgF
LRAAGLADDYRNALMLYGKSHWADARGAFQRVFDADPSGELADNALFWIGETYFAAGDYGNAMKYYERVTKEYGETNKAPDALFKTGLAFEKTGDLAMARRAFDECIRRYPYSTPAASAKLELKRIKY